MQELPFTAYIKDLLKRRKGKGNVGQKEATKKRNRQANRTARKSRRLNLRRGKVAGK